MGYNFNINQGIKIMTENGITYQVTVTPKKTEWRLNGQLHRENGPAREFSDGTKSWYLNGKLHREDGPAHVYSDGTKSWYLNGKLHRVDGPAREFSDGRKEWWIDGINYTEAEFLVKTQPAKELTIAEVEKLLGYPVKIVK